MKNCVATMEVKQILDSEDNIISQLQKLRKELDNTLID